MYAKKTSYNHKQKLLLSVTILIIVTSVLSLMPRFILPILFKMQYIVFTNKPKILIVRHNGLGEMEGAARIMKVMPKLGIKAKIVSAYRDLATNDRYLINKPELAAAAMRPDLILTVERYIPPIKIAPNYLILDQSVNKYIYKDLNGKNVFIEGFHYDFTGLLPVFKEINLLQNVYEQHGNKFKGFNWLYTAQATDYVAKPVQYLFYPGGNLSDDTRSKEKYRQIFSMLNTTGYFTVYGYKDRWQFVNASYRGFIPADGETLLKIQNQAGASLILHSKDHLSSGTPSGRIFEAVAANTVIIADKHKFIIENFGDNVLYIDIDKSADEVFLQINKHMQWILSNPSQAQLMANRCHQIFLEKFTLEQQIQKLLILTRKN